MQPTPSFHRTGAARHRVVPFIAYLLVFYAVWTGWVYLVYPRLQMIGPATLAYALVNISLRLLIWVLPVFWYLRYVEHVNPIAYLNLQHHWQRGVLIGLALTSINILGSLLRFGLPHMSLHAITWNDLLSTSLLIGVIEEIPYRGFILQQLQNFCPFWVASLITALLFVGIHLPGWIALHLLRAESVVTIFIFGIVMAIVVRYSKSLWSAIVVHSLNDFLSAVVFRL
ncbi:MAG: CPBP family intramembrane metalloprotease [Herpetosiphonaceae bacterium]|nr:CPBP family intramembrane metalloprotease [Herpetosiphonaceae bacterium]